MQISGILHVILISTAILIPLCLITGLQILTKRGRLFDQQVSKYNGSSSEEKRILKYPVYRVGVSGLLIALSIFFVIFFAVVFAILEEK